LLSRKAENASKKHQKSSKNKEKQMKRYLIITVLVLIASMGSMSAQVIGAKTNALYWATTTPNVGLEFALAERWTAELEGGYNPWTLDAEKNMKMKHWLVSPEIRYWFCNSFQGHFIGINGNYTQYNIGSLPFNVPNVFVTLSGPETTPDLQNARVEGWAVGAGLTYGYAFPITRRWNLELTCGLGWWYTIYDQFESRPCGLFQQRVEKHLLGPSTLGVSFVYMIK
jgi:hypothetical protein